MGRLIYAVRYKGTDIRELFNYLVIYIIKCNAIMDIAGVTFTARTTPWTSQAVYQSD